MSISDHNKRKNQHSNRDIMAMSWDDLGWPSKRKRLLIEANFACSACGYNTCRADGKSILEIDHIDGDHKNNARENLRVLCPNCHALTPNYRNHGRNNTRTSTRFRAGNTGYSESRRLIAEQKEAYETEFRRVVLQTHENGSIDFSSVGWAVPLAKLLNDTYKAVRERVKRLMPEFYVAHCSNYVKSLTKNQINKEVQEALHEQRQATVNVLKATVLETFASGEIDYSKFGWTTKLANRLGESGQTIGKRVRRVMPEFFVQHCFTKGHHRNLK